jgi:hypothetical protein
LSLIATFAIPVGLAVASHVNHLNAHHTHG